MNIPLLSALDAWLQRPVPTWLVLIAIVILFAIERRVEKLRDDIDTVDTNVYKLCYLDRSRNTILGGWEFEEPDWHPRRRK